MTRKEAIAIFDDKETVIENPNYLFTEIGEAWDVAIEALKERPHGELTTESAIDYLTEVGWLPEHDRVLTETTHGEWIEERDKRGHLISRKCPLCKAYHDGMLINFCPNCGADMRPKEGEDNE